MADLITVPVQNRLLQNLKDHRSGKCFSGVQGGKYYLIQTLPQLESLIEECLKKRELSLDTETSGLDWVRHGGCGIVIGFGIQDNYYIPIDHKTTEKQFYIDDIRDKLSQILLNENIDKYFWNGKFDLHVFRKLGLEVKGNIHDGLILAHLLNENGSHKLKDMSVELLDKDADKWEIIIDKWRIDESRRRRSQFTQEVKELAEKYKSDPNVLEEANNKIKEDITLKQDKVILALAKELAKVELKDSILSKNKKDDISYDFIPLDDITPYACADVHYTHLLVKKFLIEIQQDPHLLELYQTESKLLRILFELESAGIKIDRKYLEDLGPRLDEEIEKQANSIFEAVGYQFNIDSDQQLIDVFQKVGVQLTKLTKGSAEKLKNGEPGAVANFSVDKEVLEQLATKYKFAQSILDYRSACKIKGTYRDGILEKLDERDFVHPNVNQNVTSGRMSGSNPNFTNIPARDKTIRRCVTNIDDGYVYVFIDYSQVELRMIAHYSKDPVLLSCYPFDAPSRDVHAITMSEVVLEKSLDIIDLMKGDKTGHSEGIGACLCPDCLYEFYRGAAKRTNFGIGYQCGPKALQQQISTPERVVTEDQCKEYIDRYFKKYKGVKRWIDSTNKYIVREGIVQNAFGRYRRFPAIKKEPFWKQNAMCRTGSNFLIQGTCADLFKKSIVRVNHLLEGKKSRMVNFVHDEIQFYFHKDELYLLKDVKREMEDFNFDVPIIAEISYSNTNWADKKALKL